MMRFYRAILRYPRAVIGATLLLTLFFAWHMRKVKFENSIEELLPADHPSVLQDHEIKQVFKSREMILISVAREDGIFRPSTLRKVRDITNAAWQITVTGRKQEKRLKRWAESMGGPHGEAIRAILADGLTAADRAPVNNLLIAVRQDSAADSAFLSDLADVQLRLSPLSDVVSLAAVDNIMSSELGLDVRPPMEEVPETPEGADDLAATVFENEMFLDLLVSPDSTGTLILAELAFYYDDHLDVAEQVFRELEAVVAPYQDPEVIQLGGVPMVNVYTSQQMAGDMAKLTPLVILLVMVVMYLSFRMLKGVFIPLSVVLVALVWTLGAMGLVGRPITLVVSFMPVMLIAIGIADGIHLVTEYRLLWTEFGDHEHAILETMRRLWKPVILTSLTTMAGFLSLSVSSLRSIRDFGVFTTIGVFAAMVFSLTFVPAALKLMKPPKLRFEKARASPDRLTRLLQQVGDASVRHRRGIYVGAMALVALGIPFVARIDVGSTMTGIFKKDSEIYKASQTIGQKYGGIEVMNIVIDTGREGGLKDPEVLGTIAALQDTLESLPIVGYTTSLADYVKRTNLVMNDNDPSYNRLPSPRETVIETGWAEDADVGSPVERQVVIDGRDQISQYLLLYENAGGDDLEKLVDFDYRKANVIVMIRDDHTPHLRRVLERAAGFAEAHFDSDIEVTFAGCSTLCVVADNLIIPGQLKSLGLAFLVVFALLTIMFRSLKYGVLGMAPILLTVLLVFVILGAFGVRLDAVAALIASIVLGIGVDYSVHFLARYRSARLRGFSCSGAVRETQRTSGRAIVFNSLAVALGFLVLLLASIWPVIHLGWIVAANMILSATLAMVLLPALLGSVEERKVES